MRERSRLRLAHARCASASLPRPPGALHIGGARTALYNWLMARGHGGHAGPAHRGHRPRALDARERRADPRRAALAGARLGRGPDLAGLAHRAPPGGARSSCSAEGRPTARPRRPTTSRPTRTSTAPTRGFRGDGGGRGRRPPARPRRRRDGRPRPHPRRHDLPARPPRRPGHRPRGRQRRSTTSRSPSTTSTPRSPTSSAARTTSPTRPSSCSSTRRSGASRPLFAHLPLLHGPDGKKLSKRHGAASVQELRDAGYLPEAVRNYLALLGWGAADDETILSTDELVERFDVARVSKNPAQFDEQKLRWMNGRYVRELSVDELTARLEAFTGRTGLREAVAISAGEDPDARGLLAAGRASSSTGRPTTPAAREKWLDAGHRHALGQAREALAAPRAVRRRARSSTRCARSSRRAARKPKDVFQPIRVALAGTTISPGIFETPRRPGARRVAAAPRRGARYERLT